MIFRRLQGWWLTLGLMIGAGLYALLFVLITWLDYVADRSARLTSVAQVQEQMLSDALQAFESLMTFSGQDCSADHLRLMFQLRHSSPYINDVGLSDLSNILCSTSGGVTPWENVVLGDLEYVDQNSWLVSTNAPLPWVGPESKGVMILYNTYVMYQDFFNIAKAADAYGIEIHYKFDEQHTHIIYQRGDVFASPTTWRQRTLVDVRCLPSANNLDGYCVSLGKTVEQVAREHRPITLLSLLLFGLIQFLTLYLLERWLEYRNSVRVRVTRSWENGFYCTFQPIVDMQMDRISNLEVLARFRDSIGPMSPIDFIPKIIKMERTVEFTNLIIKKSLSDLEVLMDEFPHVGVSFNIFPEDLVPTKVDYLIQQIQMYRPARHIGDITIEILESGELEMAAMAKVIPKFREANFLVSLDDFGTGYSNMVTLQRLSLNKLKIDQSFVRDMMDESVKATMVPHMIGIAESLGLKVVAEGVEEQSQADLLKTLGVDYGQGWLYGKPLEVQDLLVFLRDFKEKAKRKNSAHLSSVAE